MSTIVVATAGLWTVPQFGSTMLQYAQYVKKAPLQSWLKGISKAPVDP